MKTMLIFLLFPAFAAAQYTELDKLISLNSVYQETAYNLSQRKQYEMEKSKLNTAPKLKAYYKKRAEEADDLMKNYLIKSDSVNYLIDSIMLARPEVRDSIMERVDSTSGKSEVSRKPALYEQFIADDQIRRRTNAVDR